MTAVDSCFENVLLSFNDAGTVAEFYGCHATTAEHELHAILLVRISAYLTLADCSVEVGSFGDHASDAGSSLVLYATVFLGLSGCGVDALRGARVEMHDCAVRACHQHAIAVRGAGTQVLVTGGCIANCGSCGIACRQEALVEVSSMHVEGVVLSFVVHVQGVMCLDGCSSQAAVPYKAYNSGKLFCEGCSPNDKSYPLPPRLQGLQ